MGTRAFIGHLPTPDTYAARYVHWDGSPRSLGPTLAALITRDGAADTVEAIMSAQAGWSSVDERTPDPAGAVPDATADYWTPEHYAHLIQTGTYSPEQYDVRPGLGIAYADPEHYTLAGAISADAATISAPGGWTEWGYLIDPAYGSLYVVDATSREIVATVPLDALGEADWTGIECGTGWEQCSHYAWVHDANAPRESRVTMRQWIGAEPLTQRDATAVICDGVTYVLTGTSCAPSWRREHPDGIPVLGRAGKGSMLHLGRTTDGVERWFALSETSTVTDVTRYSLVMPEKA